jgi:hypothetical protein
MEENTDIKNEEKFEPFQISSVEQLNEILTHLSFHLSESGRLMMYLPQFGSRGKKLLELSDFILSIVEKNMPPEKITEEKTDEILDEILNAKL